MDLIAFETPEEALDDGFCQWFVGWAEAAAEWGIRLRRGEYRFAFEAAVGRAQLGTLSFIRDRLNVGRVLAGGSAPEKPDRFRFVVDGPAELAKLVALFEAYPFKTRAARRRFDLWQAAFDLNGRRAVKDERHRNAMRGYAEALAHGRRAAGPPAAGRREHVHPRQRSLFE